MPQNYFQHRIELGGVSLEQGISEQRLIGRLNSVPLVIELNPIGGQKTNSGTEPEYYAFLEMAGVKLTLCGLWEKQGNNGDYLIGSFGGVKILALPNNHAGELADNGSREPDYQVFGLSKNNNHAKPQRAAPEPRKPSLPKKQGHIGGACSADFASRMPSKKGKTALQIAIQAEDSKMVKRLMAGGKASQAEIDALNAKLDDVREAKVNIGQKLPPDNRKPTKRKAKAAPKPRKTKAKKAKVTGPVIDPDLNDDISDIFGEPLKAKAPKRKAVLPKRDVIEIGPHNYAQAG